MFIKEVVGKTGLTKKAVIYYISKGLISPETLENGYRNFSKEDIEKLEKISILRSLGIGIQDIKEIISSNSNEILQKISVQKEIENELEAKKQNIIKSLCEGKKLEDVKKEIETLNAKKSILERMLDSFPGYYGRFISLYFSRFLNEPVESEEQEKALSDMIDFLDNVPEFNMPEELQEYLFKMTENVGISQIEGMIDKKMEVIENYEEFIEENKEILCTYLEFKKTEEYKNSKAYRIMEYMKEFNATSGYNDIFIPLMKKLSKSYLEHYKKIEKANEKFLEKYSDYF
ncbi:MAG: MerR family transcriptional regulator [Clostridiales bacterium]|nr:MAG: MerR family transcriptional regulator [Clostridiales bacterium]